MNNRFREHQLKIYLTDEELNIFKEKMKSSRSKTMSHFIRKCVMEKEIYVVDMSMFRYLQHLLGKNANNINQIAKHTNTTGIIYKDDIEDIKNKNDELSMEIIKIQNLLTENLIKRNKHHGNN